MGSIDTSSFVSGTAKDAVTTNDKIKASDLRATLAVLSTFTAHTHTLTDTYTANCDCECDCNCNCP